MKGTFVSNYRSKSGASVFVYAVSGSKAELESYRQAQGDNFKENDKGQPLYFAVATDFSGMMRKELGKSIELIVTLNGKVVVDTQAQNFAIHAKAVAILPEKIAEAWARPEVRTTVAAQPAPVVVKEPAITTGEQSEPTTTLAETVNALGGDGTGSETLEN